MPGEASTEGVFMRLLCWAALALASCSPRETVSPVSSAHLPPPGLCPAGAAARIAGVSFGSIQAAVTSAQVGDTVYICPGVHTGTVYIQVPGAITLAADSGSSADTVLSGPGLRLPTQRVGGTLVDATGTRCRPFGCWRSTTKMRR